MQLACGSKEFELPLSRFPSGESRGGRVPPTPQARCAPAKTAGTHHAGRLPPQEGCRPLVHPPLASSADALYFTNRTFHLLIKPDNLTCYQHWGEVNMGGSQPK